MPAEALAVPMQHRGRTSNEWRAFRSVRWIKSVDEIEDLDKVARRTFRLKDDNPKSASRLKSSTSIRAGSTWTSLEGWRVRGVRDRRLHCRPHPIRCTGAERIEVYRKLNATPHQFEHTRLPHISSVVFHVSDPFPPKVERGLGCRLAAFVYLFV
jgi:hypothetical protein